MQEQTLKLPVKMDLSHLDKPRFIELKLECPNCTKEVGSAMLKSKLKLLSQNTRTLYSPSFVRSYLLLKINNLKKYGGKEWHHFSLHLTMFYNEYIQHERKYQFKLSYNDSELLAQILLQSGIFQYLSEQMVGELLDSNGLVLASAVEGYARVKHFLEKSECVVAMGLVTLHARTNPFVPIVHQDKNHNGECNFASIIYELIQVDHKVHKENINIVQDPYSLRCTPQVHGVVYDCFSQLQHHLSESLNKPQGRYITLNGEKCRNLAWRSQTETLMLDSLVCGLNQIGHMSFLRSERMLNKYLFKNEIVENYELFMLRLKKVAYLVVRNKTIANPTNVDTVIMNNYEHDIYVDEGTPYTKLQTMLSNLREIISLQIMVSMYILGGIYGQQRLFMSEKMEKLYQRLLVARNEGGYERAVEAVGKWMEE